MPDDALFRGVDGQYYPNGWYYGVDGQYHAPGQVLALDGTFRPAASELGWDGQYHAPCEFGACFDALFDSQIWACLRIVAKL